MRYGREHKNKQMKQKTEIEIEFSETVAYSRRSERFESFCPQCKSLVEMSTPQIAAILTRTTEREVYRLIETGKVHFVETGSVLVCLKSFTKALSGLQNARPISPTFTGGAEAVSADGVVERIAEGRGGADG